MGRRDKDEQFISDLELIRRCLEGDIRAEETLYKRYFSFAMSVCIRYTKDENEAMEMVNDSYMKVLDNLRGYDTTRTFKTWYGKILVNTAIDNYRRNFRYTSGQSLDEITETEIVEPEIDSDISASEIIALFNRLPVHLKVTFSLYEIEGYSHEEISDMLGISAATSRANLSKAKKMLRELYIRNHSFARRTNETI